MLALVSRWLLTLIVAILAGKLVARVKLPSIIGWLLTGMLMGPYALNLMNEPLLSTPWYGSFMSIFETTVGIMVGSELIWWKIKKSGKAIITITIMESMGTFLVVSTTFGLLFWLQDIPLYLALLFGGIALATAPVPALSIISEYKTKGPVSSALLMVAALDDLAATAVFFTLIALLSSLVFTSGGSLLLIPIMLVVPLIIGAIVGKIAGKAVQSVTDQRILVILLLFFILLTTGIGHLANGFMEEPLLNYLLMGMAFSAVLANTIPEEKLGKALNGFAPILNLSFILFIINLGAPLNYQLILGAGLYTFLYIISRAFGKYYGTYLGAKLSHSEPTVRKYLGLTLLPHSGVSLVFTSIATNMLMPVAPELASIIGGTIAAAAIINEVIAVIIAKKAFVLAGELKE
ncbi:cation:proton antiporter [Lacticigenium naphthae]|uniref:cation:proton antiporter n=1 Tax=Lacticigenium naphthae TaxID=515351 RepID=UPI00042174A2|nr:cation:proton antiporter [Lacticigenium naphthae]